MNMLDVRTSAVRFLRSEAAKVKKRPHQLAFSAKDVSVAVGGYAGTLGKVADEVAADLSVMGIPCRYYRNRKPTVFVLDLVRQ
jgi:hypothetical protein